MMKIGEELAKARKRKGISQDQLAHCLPISRESVAKYEVGTRKLPDDLRGSVAIAVDDEEFFFAMWNDAAGEVAIPFFNGDYIDQHPASMVFLVNQETNEALDHLRLVSWVKPVHMKNEMEKEEMQKVIFELLDAAASIVNLVAVVCREYRFSMRKIFKAWRLTLKVKKYKK